MPNAQVALERLCATEYEVSAHYLIARSGEIYQMVDEARRAWHAGAGSWRGAGDVNSRSIGIELDNNGRTPFSAPQMDALEALLGGVMARWKIPPAGVIAHSDIAPTRKTDPGRRFDWRRLALAGLAVWPDPTMGSKPDKAAFEAGAIRFGYGAEPGFDPVFEAFRQRFRPAHTGPLDRTDMAMITALALDAPAPHA